MLKDLKLFIDEISKDMEEISDFVKNISTCICGKEVIFYDENTNKWYSRVHCDYMTFSEILVWLQYEIEVISEKSLK